MKKHLARRGKEIQKLSVTIWRPRYSRKDAAAPPLISLRRFVLFIVLFSSLHFLVSCSEKNDAVQNCPPTIDTVKILLTKKHNGREFYLVKRISGWHDKTVIIQLFDQVPTMNACNEDLVKPIFEDSIDMEKSLAKLSVDLKNERYQLLYSDATINDNDIALEFNP